MTRLSNSLTDLADKVKETNRLSDLFQHQSAEKALEAGHLLIEAKEGCRHGEWLPFLKRAEIPERHSQRLMQLARSGLKSASVTDLGGVIAALRWLSDRRLPSTTEYLMVSLGDDRAKALANPFAFVLPSGAAFRVVMFDLNEASPHSLCTDKAIGDPWAVWQTLYRTLDYRIHEMVFDFGPLSLSDENLRALYERTGRPWEDIH